MEEDTEMFFSHPHTAAQFTSQEKNSHQSKTSVWNQEVRAHRPPAILGTRCFVRWILPVMLTLDTFNTFLRSILLVMFSAYIIKCPHILQTTKLTFRFDIHWTEGCSCWAFYLLSSVVTVNIQVIFAHIYIFYIVLQVRPGSF